MKKLLFIFTVLFFTACTEQTVQKKDLPIEVVNLKETKKFDTLLVIETEKSVYQFNQNQEYIGKMSKTNEDFFGGFLILVVLFLFFLIILAIIL